ncbi:DUF58 domain-containing protein [Polymorphospora lycopeni]|uniref:DUF58 domain-containing protein n=1 Tax=Polymorphospora lycopeni TaxID=3140240 RepID=A0ABV5CJN4_9ACTN
MSRADRRLRRRPAELLGLTGNGLATGIGAAALLAAGVATGYPTLVGVGAALLAVVAVAALLVRLPVRVEVHRTVTPDRVTVHAGATGQVEIRNVGRLATAGFEVVDMIDGDSLRIAVPALPRGGSGRVTYPVPTPRRGVFQLGPLHVERRDPLGLAMHRSRLAAPAKLWVHPRVRPVRPLPVGIALDFEGQLSENAQRGSTAFASLREYRVGDDPRQIHWRSTARIGTLVVQDRVDTSEPTATILIDTRPDVFDEPRFEEAVELAASLLVATTRIGQSVTLLAPGEEPGELSRGPGQLDRLAALRRTDRGDAGALLRLLRRAPAGGSLIAITGPDQTVVTRLSAERRRYARVVIAQLGAVPEGAATTGRAGLAVLRAADAGTAVGAFNQLSGGRR